MATTTAKQWQRRALKAETELETLHWIRQTDGKREMDMASQLAMCKVALKEAQDAIAWALEGQP